MIRARRALALPALLLPILCARAVGGKAAGPARLRITYPEGRLTTRHTRLRIAGSCDPSCAVSIAGAPSRVYPTGAFVGFLPIRPGGSSLPVVAECRGGREEARVEVECRDPLLTSPVSPLTMDGGISSPSADTVLQPGDELHLRCKGSPGMSASWSLGGVVADAPMREGPALRGDDGTEIRGIYRASYTVRDGDRASGARVRFRIRDARGRAVSAVSPGRVTLLPRPRITRGGIGKEGAPASDEPGGARAWRLEPGSRVNLCGESGDAWRVLLAAGTRCWVPKKSVRQVRGEGAWPLSTAGAPSVERTEEGATVRIPLDGAPPMRVSGGKAFDEISVELFGVSPAPVKRRAGGAGPVETVEIPATEADILEAIVKTRGAPWGYAARRTPGGIALDVKAPPGRDPSNLTVAIDPGHGGAQAGAVSPTGLKEKDVNLAVARGAAAFLRGRGVRVVMTRDDDRALSLDERIGRARRGGAQILVSVHHDSCPGCCDPLSRRGAGAYYGTQHSKALAEAILSSLEAGGAISRGTRRAGYAVTAPTDFLAVLVECRYLSHPDDEAQILDDGYALRTGGQIGAGVLDFLRRAG